MCDFGYIKQLKVDYCRLNLLLGQKYPVSL
jgi:hypothetical protein